MSHNEGISRSCNEEDHSKCDVMWRACPHHLSEEEEPDPFEAFDAMEGKPLMSLSECESERENELRE